MSYNLEAIKELLSQKVYAQVAETAFTVIREDKTLSNEFIIDVMFEVIETAKQEIKNDTNN